MSARYNPSLLRSRAASSTGPPSSSPNEHRVNSILLLLSVVPRFPITQRENPKALLCPARPSLRPHLLPLSLLLTVFQPCQPARWAWNEPIISPVRMLCFAVSSLLFLLGESLCDLCIILISVESGLSSNINFSETLF